MTEKSSIKSRSALEKRDPAWIIFDHYCRKQALQKNHSTFEDIQSGLHMLHIGKFGIIIKQLDIKIPRQQIISIFQSHSISQVMSYQLFEEAIQEIIRDNPDVREKVNSFASKISNASKNKLEPSSYHFKVISHSGKIEKQIIDQLEDRKKKKLSLKLDIEIKKEKEKQTIERKMGIRRRKMSNISKDEESVVSSHHDNEQKQKYKQKQRFDNDSAPPKRFRSLNPSPRPQPQAQDLYIQSFLGDDEDDQYLDSLYKPKIKDRVARRRQSLINDTKAIVNQINQFESQKNIRNFQTIERENNKKMERGSRIIRKYKLDY